MKNHDKGSSDPVAILIEEEKVLASQIIPKEALRLNLKERMDKESGRRALFLRVRLKGLIVVAGIVLLLSVGIIDLLKKDRHEFRMVSSMAQFLEQSCGLNNLIQMKNEAKQFIPKEPSPPNSESLRGIFLAIIDSHPQSRPEESEPAHELRSTHYDLSQTIEILFQRQVIHNGLYKYAQNKKEEKIG